MYPNPAEQSASVDLTAFNGNTISLSILNAMGQRLHSQPLKANGPAALNLEGYFKGLYFVQVEANGKLSTSKLTIK
ncbi:MAG TPA: T9SS type A sorting domain-containing protein [Bacteroidia bacterium]